MPDNIVKFKKRGAKAAPRKVVLLPHSDSDPSSSEAEGKDGHVVKRRKVNGNALKASTINQPQSSTFEGATKYEADRSAVIAANTDATKQSNWYEEKADDALSSTNLLGSTRSLSKPQSLIEKDSNAPDRKLGPQKSSNVRTITMTDYTPDVCKDYKQTGFCGFGDGCKFLHAREDYAAGWKLDRDWEISNQGKQPSGTVIASANRNAKQKEEVVEEKKKEIPFACIICKNPYKNPIVTKCGHYFCESCALKRYSKDPTCAACGEKTYGVFSTAKNLQKRAKKELPKDS